MDRVKHNGNVYMDYSNNIKMAKNMISSNDSLCGYKSLKEKLTNFYNPYVQDGDTWHIINQFWEDHNLDLFKELIADKELIYSEIFSNIPDGENISDGPIDRFDCISFEISQPLSKEENDQLLKLNSKYISETIYISEEGENYDDELYCTEDGVLIVPIKYCVNLPKSSVIVSPFTPVDRELYPESEEEYYGHDEGYGKEIEIDDKLDTEPTEEILSNMKLQEYDRIKRSDEIVPYITEAFDKYINEMLLLINDTNKLMTLTEKQDIMYKYNLLMKLFGLQLN